MARTCRAGDPTDPARLGKVLHQRLGRNNDSHAEAAIGVRTVPSRAAVSTLYMHRWRRAVRALSLKSKRGHRFTQLWHNSKNQRWEYVLQIMCHACNGMKQETTCRQSQWLLTEFLINTMTIMVTTNFEISVYGSHQLSHWHCSWQPVSFET